MESETAAQDDWSRKSLDLPTSASGLTCSTPDWLAAEGASAHPKQPRRKQKRKKEKKHHLLESLLLAGWGALGTQRAVQRLEAQGVDRDVG